MLEPGAVHGGQVLTAVTFAKCLPSSPFPSFHSHPCPYPFPDIIRNRTTLGWSGGTELGAAGCHQLWKSIYEAMERLGAPAPGFWKQSAGSKADSQRSKYSTAAATRSAEENNREKH